MILHFPTKNKFQSKKNTVTQYYTVVFPIKRRKILHDFPIFQDVLPKKMRFPLRFPRRFRCGPRRQRCPSARPSRRRRTGRPARAAVRARGVACGTSRLEEADFWGWISRHICGDFHGFEWDFDGFQWHIKKNAGYLFDGFQSGFFPGILGWFLRFFDWFFRDFNMGYE